MKKKQLTKQLIARPPQPSPNLDEVADDLDKILRDLFSIVDISHEALVVGRLGRVIGRAESCRRKLAALAAPTDDER
jgi:hypothetical protein